MDSDMSTDDAAISSEPQLISSNGIFESQPDFEKLDNGYRVVSNETQKLKNLPAIQGGNNILMMLHSIKSDLASMEKRTVSMEKRMVSMEKRMVSMENNGVSMRADIVVIKTTISDAQTENKAMYINIPSLAFMILH